jgi:hypothetical protein
VAASVATSFTPLGPGVRQLLAKTPVIPATLIAERVGWTGSSRGSATTSVGYGLIIIGLTPQTG